MWGWGSLNTLQTNSTSLPTTAVRFAGRPAYRMGLWGDRSEIYMFVRFDLIDLTLLISKGIRWSLWYTCLLDLDLSAIFIPKLPLVDIERWLTHYIQLIGVIDASVFVLHKACVVTLVWGHHGLHDYGPHVFPQLRMEENKNDLKCFHAIFTPNTLKLKTKSS